MCNCFILLLEIADKKSFASYFIYRLWIQTYTIDFETWT